MIPDFGVTVIRDEGAALMHISGELDLAAAPELRRHLGLVDEDVRQVTMDLAGVSFIDSSGLSALVSCLKRLRERGGDLSLRSPTANTMKVFEITGLTEIFAIVDGDAVPAPADRGGRGPDATPEQSSQVA